mmetsp:Transcript_26763/g.67563  ORF Transcript_26763/g.67563 Transcript_26763/m.67563 type:complete len:180 (+) Transcript_26763:39-578(+)|eukprot:CAMPEP_0173437460 /NCGR_PEP_ID=MMETSP1357-20121228/18038_1 /TAXON_ID=77926 /ORGANISM="Hemiselmis rufescens, Strain PCC563" /LENGTH=179 /DNA_ID=CAMNT_0014402641 /DNA_START=39 /DNA_END=578 /DNA_ORIENTATION=-
MSTLPAAEVVKGEANGLYGEGKLAEALEKYSEALKMLPEVDPDDEEEFAELRSSKPDETKLRTVLLANRAQCHLQMGKAVPEGIESKEARGHFMKANMDAAFAAELSPDYAKAHYRKGLALLGMPDTQQRSKEATMALKAALACKDASDAMRKEIGEVLKYADERRFEGVDMPENCVVS